MSSVFNDFTVQIKPVEAVQSKIEKIKRNIERYASYQLEKKGLEKVYLDVFEGHPFSLEEQSSIVQAILTENRYYSEELLNIFLSKNPDYELSQLQDVLLSIIKDKDCLLDYKAVQSRLQDSGILSEENIDLCTNLAFKRNHHGIFAPSEIHLNVNDYVLNFLWINLDAQSRENDAAENVFGTGLDKKVSEQFLSKVSNWAEAHPGSSINVWIDTALVTDKAAQRTMMTLKEMSERQGVSFSLKDIRVLPKVQSSMNRYFHPSIPVYFRVDLAKIVIVDHMMGMRDLKYIVVSDIDISPQPKDMLFDKRTISFLEDLGYVFNRCGTGNFENSFFIFSTGNQAVQEAHEKALIQMLDTKIRSVEKFDLQTPMRSDYIFSSQTAFSGYLDFQELTENDCNHAPRKVVATPRSQFNLGSFSDLDHQSEQFRFRPWSDKPYVRKGRAMQEIDSSYQYTILSRYRDWNAEPLSLDAI